MEIFKVIKYSGNNETFVWKFPGEDFNTLSQLIVSESQEAVFFKDGKALDLFCAGRYTLHSQNIPVIRKLVNLPFNGVSPFSCQVYFINKVVSMDVMWGTTSPIPIQDAKYPIILPVRANGQFAVRVIDSKNLLINLVGSIDKFDQATLKKYFKGILLTNIKDYIAKEFVAEQVSFLEIHSHLKDISNGIFRSLDQEFHKYGIELVNFNVNEISVPEDDPSFVQLKKALAEKAMMDIKGYSYQQERAFNVLDRAAANEGSASNIMGAGMGLGMGVNLGNVFGNTMTGAMGSILPVNGSGADLCPVCHSPIPPESAFCPKCGSKIEVPSGDNVVCPRCKASVPRGKFCLECGAPLERKCGKCGASLAENAKFCFECGNKVQ